MTFTGHINSLGICHQLKKFIIYIGLLISRPSVFVWGPEACLSTFFVIFVETRTLYEGKLYLR